MFARIANRDYSLVGGSIRWQQDAVTDFNVEIPAVDIPNYRELEGVNVAVIQRGQVLVSGFFNDTPDLQLSDNGLLTVNFGCFDEIGRLTWYRARSSGHYQNSAAIGIISDLLSVTDWEIGDTSTMEDVDIETTIDLRSKDTLFSQIVAVVKAIPGLHLRYGGMREDGTPLLDIGHFDTLTHVAIQGRQLSGTPKLTRNQLPSYSVVEAYGSLSGDQRITLADALNDARTTAHPDYARYPIEVDAGTYVVRDQDYPDGREILKSFPTTKTKNDVPPTEAEVAEVGYALWLKTIQFMKQYTPHEAYQLVADFETLPLVGDRCYLRSQVSEPVLDGLSQSISYLETFSVDADYRIVRVNFNFETGVEHDHFTGQEMPVDRYGLELTSAEDPEPEDPDLEVFEELEQADKADKGGASGTLIPPGVQVTHLVSAINDCTYDTPSDGKSYTFTAPPPPIWAESVSYQVSIPELDYVPTSEPVVPGDDLTICVGPWPPSADLTITVYFIYSI